jgi:hypothetical protein
MVACITPRFMYPPSSEAVKAGNKRYSMRCTPAQDVDRGVSVPCGQCICCRLNQQREWSLRMQLEARMHQHAYFATLTYNDDAMPRDGSLRKADLQGFLKRFRVNVAREFEGAPVRFSSCGEYGTGGKRPHYHVLLFMGDVALPDLVPWRRSESDALLYRSAFLERAWSRFDPEVNARVPMGFCEIGNVEPESCNYVAGYHVKHLTGERGAEYLRRMNSETGEVWQVAPEFTQHSTAPGIGAPWFQAFPDDVVSFRGMGEVRLSEKERYPVPGYFLRMLKNNTARVAAGKSPFSGLEKFAGQDAFMAAQRKRLRAIHRAQLEELAKTPQASGKANRLLGRFDNAMRVKEFREHMVSRRKESL